MLLLFVLVSLLLLFSSPCCCPSLYGLSAVIVVSLCLCHIISSSSGLALVFSSSFVQSLHPCYFYFLFIDLLPFNYCCHLIIVIIVIAFQCHYCYFLNYAVVIVFVIICFCYNLFTVTIVFSFCFAMCIYILIESGIKLFPIFRCGLTLFLLLFD